MVLFWRIQRMLQVTGNALRQQVMNNEGMLQQELPLLLFSWAFTRQLTHLLRVLMPYNSPLDSLSCDRTGGLLLKPNILICVHPHPGSPTHLTWFLFLCSSINVTIFFWRRGGGGWKYSHTFSSYMQLTVSTGFPAI